MGIAAIGFQTAFITLFSFFFGSWFGSTIVPLYYPHLLGTPAGGMLSLGVSAALWIGLSVSFFIYKRRLRR